MAAFTTDTPFENIWLLNVKVSMNANKVKRDFIFIADLLSYYKYNISFKELFLQYFTIY